MPYKKKSFAKKRKTPYRRKRFRRKTYRRKKTYVPRQLNPPTRMLLHEYDGISNLHPSTNAAQVSFLSMRLFRANCIDDVDYSFQYTSERYPKGYMQVKSIYGDYIVTRAVITATPILVRQVTRKGYTGIRLERHQPLGKNDLDPAQDEPTGWNYHDGPSSPSAIHCEPEILKNNNWIMNGQHIIDTGANGFEPKQHTMKCVYEARKVYGGGYSKNHDLIRHPGVFESRTSLTPDKEHNQYFRIWALFDPEIGASQQDNIKYSVNIKYYVLWSNKLQTEQNWTHQG